MGEADKITTQMKKGILEYLILSIIAKGESYTNDIIKSLKKANLIVVEGTMYPLLSRLKTDKLLEYIRVESQQGPPRKYYRLTSKGKESLKSMDKVRKELVKSVSAITK
ncbi:MAG: PadR family transcriptional regulator [Candidatus Absconditabacteria bacterium]|nr:PadR family transcriptional regulator [Candidatus Absconditabacteria bacterium]MDD3868549.1 PadR family transcriptional regulator [Candidatus Absconditabacteria bacterium]MDD4714113.1 PadR family transcriptional regulator [Candidatus Absconditabacteria bacterium]